MCNTNKIYLNFNYITKKTIMIDIIMYNLLDAPDKPSR